MGGINHQPCHGYIEESTVLSRSVSEAQKFLWEANISIEDVILREINQKEFGSYDSIVISLEKSVDALKCADNDFRKLSLKMDRMRFVSKPTALNFEQLTAAWKKENFIIDDDQWKEIVEIYKEGGFRNALYVLQLKFVAVNKETRNLLAVIKQYRQSAENRLFMSDVEENKIPLRQQFAKILTRWSEALNLFRYSSLISTEIYLRDMNYPALAGEADIEVTNPSSKIFSVVK